MSSQVEHINITVQDLDAAIRFVETALPDFQVRHREESNGRQWAHVGTQSSYLALEERSPAGGRGAFNHVGVAVDDLPAVVERLRVAGYRPGYGEGKIFSAPSRLRAYYLDPDSNEYEFIQYLTDDPVARNSYDD